MVFRKSLFLTPEWPELCWRNMSCNCISSKATGMKYFITGITGFIGTGLAHRLLTEGHEVRGLARHPGRYKEPVHSGLELIAGDLDPGTHLEALVRGCDAGFHLAADTSVWNPDPDRYRRVNVQGTLNLLGISAREGVKKVVIVSTAGVIGPSTDGNPLNERSARPKAYFNGYESSKAMMERDSLRRFPERPEIVIVNPTRLYGPGLMNQANSVTRIIDLYRRGKWFLLPGNGRKKGNYVFVEDVVNGLVLAMEKGKAGEQYILGGENLSYREFFDALAGETGRRRLLIPFPVWLMMAVSWLFLLYAVVTRKPPPITPAWTRKYLNDFILSSNKAERELGYVATSFREGLKKTLRWLDGKS